MCTNELRSSFSLMMSCFRFHIEARDFLLRQLQKHACCHFSDKNRRSETLIKLFNRSIPFSIAFPPLCLHFSFFTSGERSFLFFLLSTITHRFKASATSSFLCYQHFICLPITFSVCLLPNNLCDSVL